MFRKEKGKADKEHRKGEERRKESWRVSDSRLVRLTRAQGHEVKRRGGGDMMKREDKVEKNGGTREEMSARLNNKIK